MLHAVVHAADIQDRDGGALVMAMLSGLFPFRGKIYADGGYQGGKSQAAVKRVINQINVKIVKRADAVKGFLVLPKRWAVERTLAWLNRCRRLAKDWECLNRRARGFLLLASVRLRVRRLGRNTTLQLDESGFSCIWINGLAGNLATAASVSIQTNRGCETMNTESRRFRVANGIIVVIATAFLAACSLSPPPPPPPAQPVSQPPPPAYTPPPPPPPAQPMQHRG